MKPLLALFCILSYAAFAAAPARFTAQVVANDLKYGYQLAAVDVNHDGRKDLIAVDEAGSELAWTRTRAGNAT